MAQSAGVTSGCTLCTLSDALVGYLSCLPQSSVDMGTPLVPNLASIASSHLFFLLFSQSEDAHWNLTGAMNEVLPLGTILFKNVLDSLHLSRAVDKPVEVPQSTHPSRTPCCVSAASGAASR
ncbi:hypothetical protein QBC45DRAFT_458326 [Copromyces sp. CBS 386.78]|nr:hypothetical protein QBC45DRAFT_458326 [Copromyces sp. CBS 386.78]